MQTLKLKANVTITIKRTEYLSIHLIQHVQDLCAESNEVLMKETKI